MRRSAKALLLALSFPLFPAMGASLDMPRTVSESFGVQLKDDRRTDEAFGRIKKTGFGYVRINIHWNRVEHERGVYDWKEIDDAMSLVRSHGLKGIVILSSSNQIYSGLIDVPEKIFWSRQVPPSPVSDDAIAGFSSFAAAAVRRYSGDDVIWEIWNEPNGDRFWAPEPNGDAYARFSSQVCQAMRGADPSATIIAPGLAEMPVKRDARHYDFLESMYRFPVATCIDALSVHPYRKQAQEPESAISDYATLRKFIADHTPPGHKPLPVVESEWGYSLTYVTPDEQAAFVLRNLFTNLISGIPLSIWYEWRDSQADGADDKEAHFGLLDASGADKVSLQKLQEFLRKIGDSTFEARLPTPDSTLYAILLRRPDDSRMLILWDSLPFANKPVPVQLQLGEEKLITETTPMPRIIDVRVPPSAIQLSMVNQ